MWSDRNSSRSNGRRSFLKQLGIACGAGVAAAAASAPAFGLSLFGSGGGGRLRLAGIRFQRLARNVSGSHIRYLLIHGDESTARQVLTEHMSAGGSGKGIAYLVENPTRNVAFRGGHLDPNRMFSNEGAQRNLELLNPTWQTSQVINGVTHLGYRRHEVVNRLIPPPGGLILALHNNQRGYSVQTEIPISDEVALNDPEHPHDFGLVSDPADFARLSSGRYNVVLQARPRGHEDGSLSRLAVQMGIRYVNLEAALGNVQKQRSMVRWVEETLQAG